MGALFVFLACVSAEPAAVRSTTPIPAFNNPAELIALLKAKDSQIWFIFSECSEEDGGAFIQKLASEYAQATPGRKQEWLDAFALVLQEIDNRGKGTISWHRFWAAIGAKQLYETILSSWDSDLRRSQDRCMEVLRIFGTRKLAKSPSCEQVLRNLIKLVYDPDSTRACRALRLLRQLDLNDTYDRGGLGENEGPWYYPERISSIDTGEARLLCATTAILQEYPDMSRRLTALAMESNSTDAIWFIGFMRYEDALAALADDIHRSKFGPRLPHILHAFEHADSMRMDDLVKESAPSIMTELGRIFQSNQFHEERELELLWRPLTRLELPETTLWQKEMILAKTTKPFYRELLIRWASPNLIMELSKLPDPPPGISKPRVIAAEGWDLSKAGLEKVRAFLRTSANEAPKGSLQFGGPNGIGVLLPVLQSARFMTNDTGEESDQLLLIAVTKNMDPRQAEPVFQVVEDYLRKNHSPTVTSALLDALDKSTSGSAERMIAVRTFDLLRGWDHGKFLKTQLPIFRKLVDDPNKGMEVAERLLEYHDEGAFPYIEAAITKNPSENCYTVVSYAAEIRTDAADNFLQFVRAHTTDKQLRAEIDTKLKYLVSPNKGLPLAYAPPFLSAWDIIVILGMIVMSGIYFRRRIRPYLHVTRRDVI